MAASERRSCPIEHSAVQLLQQLPPQTDGDTPEPVERETIPGAMASSAAAAEGSTVGPLLEQVEVLVPQTEATRSNGEDGAVGNRV